MADLSRPVGDIGVNMSKIAARVAVRFLNAGVLGTWDALSNESKGVVLGAWVYHLRQALNGRPGTVFMNGRPKPKKVMPVDDDGTPRIRIIGFEVPDVGFVDYDHDRRQVRVLSRSGTVMSKHDVIIRFDTTVSALKKAGKDLAYESAVLMKQMKSLLPVNAEPAKQRADDIAANASVDQVVRSENRWATSFFDYIGTARRQGRTIDRGRDGGPWQTSNTTVDQSYIDIGPWLESAGFSARAFEKALPRLSGDVQDTIRRALAPKYVENAPIEYSNFRIGLHDTELTLTYNTKIYYN